MIFETLNDSNERGELLLVDGGMCHWHLRRDGQITIREIIVEYGRECQGIGRKMLDQIIWKTRLDDVRYVFAKCPADLAANGWYEHMGFELIGTETTKTGKTLNLWRFPLFTARRETADSQK